MKFIEGFLRKWEGEDETVLFSKYVYNINFERMVNKKWYAAHREKTVIAVISVRFATFGRAMPNYIAVERQ